MHKHPRHGADANNPYLQGMYAAIDRESTLELPEVEGELPRDLHGIYVRNGPNPRYRPPGRYHWFDGDGMLHAVRFEDGRARYQNRWVRTEHLQDEEAAGAALWRGLLEPWADNPAKSPYKDSANTDVLVFGRELLATWYLCGMPYRIDPVSLDTRGTHAFGQAAPRRISAHPKVDPITGELMFFAYGSQPRFAHGVVSAEGALVHTADIPLPGPRLPHDMAITERYSILMDLPVFFAEEAALERRWRVAYHRDVPARFAIVPRRGRATDVRWFEAEPCYIYHTVNAWEEGDTIVMVACKTTDPMPAPDRERDGPWARVMANLRLRARLCRWRFDLRTGQTHEETIDDRSSEFPATNLGRLGRRSRYTYNMTIPDTPTLVFDGIVKYDTDTGAATSYELGPGRFCSEAVFAPRGGARGTEGEEDDGYLVTFVSDERGGAAEVLILDAREVSAGPVARVRIPQRLPAGFHACWVPGALL